MNQQQDECDYRVYTIALPTPVGLPRLSRYELNPLPFSSAVEGRKNFTPEFIKPITSQERRAKFLWIGGHHLLFLQWELMAECCDQAADAIEKSKASAATLWLNRAATITTASIAAMEFSGDFPPEVYQNFIRPAMKRVREDFAGGSSLDYFGYFSAFKKLENVFAQVNVRQRFPTVAIALHTMREASQMWFKRHIHVAKSLQPGDSLLQQELKKLAQDGQKISREKYMNETIRSPEAVRDYDKFFGVTRIERMYIEDFNLFLRFTLSAVNNVLRFSSLTPESRVLLDSGEKVMREIVDEALDPEQRLRAA